jgi:class 3 adenylate cyclase
VAERGLPVDPDEVLVNVGMHWGAGLYVGQVVTGGRLEVTALGDEVNEAARIEQSASEGAVLASKALIELLDSGDAEELGLDPAKLSYRAVAELPDASEKALRDAGTIAVTDVRD